MLVLLSKTRFNKKLYQKVTLLIYIKFKFTRWRSYCCLLQSWKEIQFTKRENLVNYQHLTLLLEFFLTHTLHFTHIAKAPSSANQNWKNSNVHKTQCMRNFILKTYVHGRVYAHTTKSINNYINLLTKVNCTNRLRHVWDLRDIWDLCKHKQIVE